MPSKSAPLAAAAANRAIATSYVLMGTWITLSAIVILYNKYILSYAGFPYPIALTMLHMMFCSIVTALLLHCGHLVGLRCKGVTMTAGTYVPTALCPEPANLNSFRSRS
jgi:hypothetical protein